MTVDPPPLLQFYYASKRNLSPGLPALFTHPSRDPMASYVTEVGVNYCSLQGATRMLHRGFSESDQLSGCICSHIDNNLHWWKRL